MSKPILLMNHTLLSKKDWCQTAPDSYIKGGDGTETWKQKAYRELIELLCRKPFVSNEAASRGIKFEAQVYAATKYPPNLVKGSDYFKEVVEAVRGGVFQKFHTKDMDMGDYILRWYGILDVEFGDRIVDIKTTGKLKPKNYQESGQDTLYRWVADKPDFQYLVAEWDEFPKIKQVAKIPGAGFLQEELEEVLKYQAGEYIEWLKTLGLYELYVDCYSHKGLGWKSRIAKKGPNQEAQLEEFYKPFREKHLAQFNKEDF